MNFPPSRFVGLIVQTMGLVLLALLSIVALSNLAGWEWGPLRRLVHFSLYGSLLAVGLGGWLWRRNHVWLACFASVLGTGFGLQVAALWQDPGSKTSRPGDKKPVSIMSFNVYRDNDRYSEVLAAIEEARPDVLFLTEMTPAWHLALAPLQIEYRYHLGSGGNLLLSRLKLDDPRQVSVSFDTARAANQSAGGNIIQLDERLRAHWRNTEILTTTVLAEGRRLRIACIHSPTPGSDLSIVIQRACALVCAQELRSDIKADASALLGDLNTSCFSPTFRFIVKETGLRDSALGFGYSPTWGPRLPREPWLPWIGIPIDHVLVSRNVNVLTRETGPALGSDHRWVLAQLAW